MENLRGETWAKVVTIKCRGAAAQDGRWQAGQYNYKDTKAFVSVPKKQDKRWVQRHSLCLSADQTSSTGLLVVKFVYMVELSSYRNKYRI